MGSGRTTKSRRCWQSNWLRRISLDTRAAPFKGVGHDRTRHPYLHDGLLLTLDDTVEFFKVVGAKLTLTERQDLLQFLRAL